jgi:M6 family metalloprotease-like protein/uncharacterized repeat protein (TIGR01451 family)
MKKLRLLPWNVAALAVALLFALVVAPPRAAAAPFAKQFTFTQPAGEVIELWGRGDEFSAVFETLDGYSVVFDAAQRAYCYAQLSPDGSKLVSTGVQVQSATGAFLGLTPHLRISAAALRTQIDERFTRWDSVMKVSDRWAALKAQTRGLNGKFAPPTTPTVGTKVGLCLLIDFSDDPATIPQVDVDNFCNGDNFNLFGNNGSVKKYFKDVSNGLLTYSNVVTIYITAPQPKSYYNDISKDCGDQANILIKDVLDTMKALPTYTTDILPTFDALTVDNNNEVIAFNVFYAGDNGGVWMFGLWPHSWGLYNVGAQELSPGGKKLFRYQITNIGNQLEIGTFCHENGHMLCGYPDLYDYTGMSAGVGMWCLMAAGNYGGGGGNPVEISAYLRRASGWATTTEIYGVSNLLATVWSAPNTNFNRFYRYQKPNVATEYFLMECRFQQGRDADAPGSGVAVWHIDELGSNSKVNLNPNTIHNNYEATLVQADNRWDLENYFNSGDQNDVYFAENGAGSYMNKLTDATSPNAHWWDGTVSGLILKDFSSRSNTMTFTIGDSPTPPPPVDSVDLAVRIAANPDPVLTNGTLYYTVTVTNKGSLPATDVVVTQLLSSTSPFLSVTVTNGIATQLGGVVTWNLGLVASNGVSSMVVMVRPLTVGIMYSSARATTTSPDANPANNEFFISTWVRPATADLTLNLTDSPDTVLIGETLTYHAAVTNRGPSQATGVVLAATLPAGMLIKAVIPSKGTGGFVGNAVTCNFGDLNSGQRATVNITAIPTTVGYFAASGRVSATEYDPAPQNNVASITTVVSPAADLTLGFVVAPNPAVVGSNFTCKVTVTNRGPSAATAVVVNQTVPAGVTVVSNTASQGTVAFVSGNVVANLGTLNVGSSATVTVTARSAAAGVYSSTATASATEADQNPADNSASVAVTVAKPFVSIVAAGGTLTAESFLPFNGAIEPNEIVTIQLRLRNVGNVSNTNLIASLLEANGVAYVTGNTYTNNYGVLPAAGPPSSGAFTFKAVNTSNGLVVATLRLRDGGKDIGTASFTFYLPVVTSFANPNTIIIPDKGPATNYQSRISVSGVTGVVGNVSVTLSNLAHTYPHDVNVLLVGPAGQKVLLMSHAGGTPVSPNPITNTTVTLDATASAALPASDQINPGSYRPAAYSPAVTFDPPAPTSGYGTNLSVFNGSNPNTGSDTNWSLYVMDDSEGDQGQITDGWSLNIKTIFPVNQLADLSLAVTAAPDPVLAGDPLIYRFTILNSGPDPSANATFTNVLPASLRLVSASASQGTVLANGNTVICYFGAIPVGATATITNVLVPRFAGLITNRASVFSSEADLNPANNYAAATITSILPQADLAVTLTANPKAAIVSSNLTYTFTVTNGGPQLALDVLASNTLPVGVTFVSAVGTNATCTNFGRQVICDLGDVAPGAGGVVVITTTVASPGKLTNTVVAWTSSNDTNTPNQASLVINSTQPMPVIAPAGATLLPKPNRSPNGVVNPGETVTISFSLVNTGQVQTANLVASLLPTGGVTAPSSNQNYGVLAPDGPAVAANFTFTASSNATTIVATLALSDGPSDLGTVSFPLAMPGTATHFSSAVPVAIPDHGAARPYPSTIYVDGSVMGLVSQVVVTLSNLTHTFASDVNVLLVSPAGQAVPLMASAGYGYSATNVTLRFEDKATNSLPRNAALQSGTFRPTSYGDTPFPYPAPVGPYGSQLIEFNGFRPTGTWKLYVMDGSPGDAGSFAGWSLDISTVSPLTPAANLAVTGSGAPTPAYAGNSLTNTFLVFNAGPDTAPGVLLTNTIPAGATLISATLSQGTVTHRGNQLLCDLGSLPDKATATLTVVLVPSTGQTLVNVAEAYPAATDLNLANNVCTFATSVVVVKLSGSFNPANQTFTLTLQGESNTAYGIFVSSDLVTWVPLTTGTTGTDGRLQFTDDTSPGQPIRFYRAQREH